MRYIINNGDGTVGIMIPATNTELTIEQIIAKDAPGSRPVPVSALPTSRVFRNAWTDDMETETVDVDVPRAQVIAHTYRRTKRSELFTPLDIEATIPAKATAAEAARQVIRDRFDSIQADIDNAATAEELELLMEVLHGES